MVLWLSHFPLIVEVRKGQTSRIVFLVVLQKYISLCVYTLFFGLTQENYEEIETRRRTCDPAAVPPLLHPSILFLIFLLLLVLR